VPSETPARSQCATARPRRPPVKPQRGFERGRCAPATLQRLRLSEPPVCPSQSPSGVVAPQRCSSPRGPYQLSLSHIFLELSYIYIKSIPSGIYLQQLPQPMVSVRFAYMDFSNVGYAEFAQANCDSSAMTNTSKCVTALVTPPPPPRNTYFARHWD